MTFLGEELRPVSSARDLGEEFDECLSYDEHITEVVSVNFITVRLFGQIRQKNIAKLQSVQNFAARIVSGTRKYDHITPVLQQLNWLPVSYMLRYRDAVMTFRCLKGLAPPRRKTRTAGSLDKWTSWIYHFIG